MTDFDLIIVGGGASGLVAGISAGRNGRRVLIVEQLRTLGKKLLATGGGSCNLANTLPSDAQMTRFGRNGRFMSDALYNFDKDILIDFFKSIGVECSCEDGVHLFPQSHKSSTVVNALESELNKLKVNIKCDSKVEKLVIFNGRITGVKTKDSQYNSSKIIIATGGKGFPSLGATGDGYHLAEQAGHIVTSVFPAMLPLYTEQTWPAACTADTIAKATIRIGFPKMKHLVATGDLIFTKNGIRGPVVLDFAREITPLLEKHKTVPLLINLTKGKNEQQCLEFLKASQRNTNDKSTLNIVSTLLPRSVAKQICILSGIDPVADFTKTPGSSRDKLIKLLGQTPLTITGHEGFKGAMITRGGISLKEVNPKNLESRLVDGLHFTGELLDLDGPCGGFNLHWAFASGYLAGAN